MVDYYPSTVAGFDGLGHVTVRVRNPSGVQDTAMISMIGIKRFGPIREIRVDS